MFRFSNARGRDLPRIAVFAALLLFLFISLVTPEPVISSGAQTSDDYRISVNVGLVILPVTVTDRAGNAVPGLGAGSFQVFEDGHPQQIALFEPEDVPVTVGLVIDNSGSMGAKRPEIAAAAVGFARSSNPQDQMFVVNFNQRISLGLPKGVAFTNDPGQILGAVSRTPASGNTALYDGLAVALEHLKTGTATRKALILISDGGDNASRLHFADLLKRAEASDAQIFTLGVFDELYTSSDKDASVMKRLAKVTGGKSYFPGSPSQIPGICQEIARDLRHQYTIGYHPSNPNPGSYHAVRVTMTGAADNRLRVSTRAGYIMPAESSAAPPVQAKASL